MLTVCQCVCFITVKWVEVSNNNIVRGSGERTINRSQNSKVIGPGSVLTYWEEKHDMGEKKPYNSPIIYFNHDKTMTCWTQVCHQFMELQNIIRSSSESKPGKAGKTLLSNVAAKSW